MARGRMLNKSVSLSIKFNNLPDDTCRLLATWIIAQLDYHGVFYADPAVVKSMVFPRRTDVTIEQIEAYLMAMRSVGLIELFEAKGQLWQWWPGFADNQVGLRADRESTDFPPPPDAIQQDDGSLPDVIQQDDGKVPAEGEHESESKLEDSPPTEEAASAQDDDDNSPGVWLSETPARRIFKAKYHASVSQPLGRGPPKKFPNLDVAKKFDKVAQRLDGEIESAIDAALTAGCNSIIRIVNYVAKWQPDWNNGKGGTHATHQRRTEQPTRPGYRVAEPFDEAESERLKAEIHAGLDAERPP